MQDSTTFPGFTCIDCGAQVMTVCNGRCTDCASGEPAPQRGSWICDRCGVSNAPHVDQCTCTAEPVANEYEGIWVTIKNVGDDPADINILTLEDVPDGDVYGGTVGLDIGSCVKPLTVGVQSGPGKDTPFTGQTYLATMRWDSPYSP